MKVLNFYSLMAGLITGIVSCNTVDPATDTDTLVQLDTVHATTTDFTRFASFIRANQFGITVKNLYHHKIFYYEAKRAPWKPINGFRAVMGGRLSKYYIATGHSDQDEYDWNLKIELSNAFSSAIATSVEAEVTPPLLLRNNKWFPPLIKLFVPVEDNIAIIYKTPPSLLDGRNICVYGPFVYDKGNDNHREIHPVEAIWWQSVAGDNTNIGVLLMQDYATRRFTEQRDYNFLGDNYPHPGWAPWVSYPQVEEIKVPFEYNAQTGTYTTVGIKIVQSHNVSTRVLDDLKDSDNGTNHQLRVTVPYATTNPNASPVLAEVFEAWVTGNGPDIGVQFSDISKSANGNMTGTIRILVSLGFLNTREAGFMELELTMGTAINPQKNTIETH